MSEDIDSSFDSFGDFGDFQSGTLDQSGDLTPAADVWSLASASSIEELEGSDVSLGASASPKEHERTA